ncbi:MAG: aspartate/glutamate racemase family protein [Alphaproteobacteria bacterium]|nr:aspartate/glutamate racemase family protein [Alphaproteobacteria bacterium]
MLQGWRARIGQIRPATAIEGAEEWRTVTPVGVAYADARTIVPKVDQGGLKVMMEQVVTAAKQLATAKVDIIVQCGAPGIFLEGTGRNAEVVRQITDATNIPAITMMEAMIDALRAVGATRVAVCSTYTDSVNAALGTYLEAHQVGVRAMKGLQLTDPYDSSLHGDDVSYRMGREVFRMAGGKVDAILVSCGTFRTFQMLQYLENDTGVPVISSNQASLWRALRGCGLKDIIPNLGSLWTRA